MQPKSPKIPFKSLKALLFVKQIAEHYITANDLEEHPGNTHAEILDAGGKTRIHQAFYNTAYNLITKHHAEEDEQIHARKTGGGITCGKGKQDTLDFNRREGSQSRHPEQGPVYQRRKHGSQQTHFPSIFISPHQGEEINREEHKAAVGHEVAQLRQRNVAYYKESGDKPCAHARKIELVKAH